MRAVAEALERVVCPLTVRVEAVVVANVEVPVTERIPFAESDEVEVRVPKVAVEPVREEIVEVIALRIVEKKFVLVALVRVVFPVTESPPKVGVPMSVYVTCPPAVVATVKLLLVEDARKVKRVVAEVVAVTPLMIVVMIPPLAKREEELMILVEDETPLILEESVLTAERRELVLIKEAVVVAVLPLMILVRVKELVEVETESVFEVLDATRLVRSVEVATPLIEVVRTAPFVERTLDEMTEVVAVTPLTMEVRVFPVTD